MKKMKKLHLLLAALLFILLIPVCKPTTIQAATLKAPKTLTVKQGKNNIAVQWSKVSGAKGYVVYRKNSPSQGWKRLKAVKAPTLKYLDKNIASGKNYYYTVRPYTSKSGKNSYGSYNKSGRNTIYLKEPKVSATKSATSVTLKWNKTTGASGYEVYRKSGSSGYSKVKTTSALSYKDTAVEPNTKYTYAVRAYKKSGNSMFRSLYYDGANLVSVKTQAEVQDPVDPDPEPSMPDINDAVESKVTYNNRTRLGIIECHNKTDAVYHNLRYEVSFYDVNNTLIYRVSTRTLCTYLKPFETDYDAFLLPIDFEYSYYQVNLTKDTYLGENDKLLPYINISSIYIQDNNAWMQLSNSSNNVVNMRLKFVVFQNESPIYVEERSWTLNVNEVRTVSVPLDIEKEIINHNNSVKTIVQYMRII